MEGKASWEQNSKLLAKKKDFRSEKNFSRICLEILQKSLINLLKKILIANSTTVKEFDAEEKKINVQPSTKFLVNYGKLGHLTTYFFDYVTLCMQKIK